MDDPTRRSKKGRQWNGLRGLLFPSKSPYFSFESARPDRLLRHFSFPTSRLNLRNRSDRRYSAQHRNVRLPPELCSTSVSFSRDASSNDSRLLFSSTWKRRKP